VRDKGLCPCPRCLIRKVDIDKMGQKLDLRYRITKARTYLKDVIHTARRFIYDLGFNIDSAAVERVLKPQSLVPTQVRASRLYAINH
jgi:AraC-like DNA-binding protein